MKAEQIAIGLRLSDLVHERITKKAKAMGVSKNALMLMLMEIGLEVWQRGFNCQSK